MKKSQRSYPKGASYHDSESEDDGDQEMTPMAAARRKKSASQAKPASLAVPPPAYDSEAPPPATASRQKHSSGKKANSKHSSSNNSKRKAQAAASAAASLGTQMSEVKGPSSNSKLICGCIPRYVVFIAFMLGAGVGIYYAVMHFKNQSSSSTDNYNYTCYDAKVNGSSLYNLAFYSSDETNQTHGIFLEFKFKNGTVMRERFHMKGISWSGFESNTNLVHGLYYKTPDFLLDLMSSHGFNAIRLPFHIGILDYTTKPNSYDKYINKQFATMSAYTAMTTIIQKAADRGMLVMLDLHSFAAGTYKEDGLWYSADYTEAQVQSYWSSLATLMQDYWNVIGADLKNEPWQTTWGDGNATTDWKAAAERLGTAVLNANPNLLVFVEGTYNSPNSAYNPFYGENLLGVASNPLNLSADKVVYSPHVYGPSVVNQGYFSDSNFPNNMANIWDTNWGYLVKQNRSAIAVGEWGTFIYSGDSASQTKQDTWASTFVNYLKTIGARDTFMWMLNPDGEDTIGLLQSDWSSIQTRASSLADTLQPTPTKLKKTSSSICFAQTG